MTNKIRALVVDDEAAILRFLKPAFHANNYELMSARTIAEATKRIAADTPDIVVLDLGLPDGDGKDVIRQVRQWSEVPIIVLSARDREAEKIEALDLGADDFVNKPFGVGELLARMRTALRHRMERDAQIPVLRTADLEIDSVRHRVMRSGVEVRLTPKEFELLSFLARHVGKSSPIGRSWRPSGGRRTEPTRNISVSISASSGRRSSGTPAIRALSSPSPELGIASPRRATDNLSLSGH
jgi:two-component system, OmpR family, KDP operon response regulator KdpE